MMVTSEWLGVSCLLVCFHFVNCTRGKRSLVWDSPHSFFLFDIQSMRSIACAKVQIIWICTSRWSGSIMSTAKNFPLSRSTYLNIQREYFFFRASCLSWNICRCATKIYVAPVSFCAVQLVWAICRHVVGREWGGVQRFSPRSPWEGQERWGNRFWP